MKAEINDAPTNNNIPAKLLQDATSTLFLVDYDGCGDIQYDLPDNNELQSFLRECLQFTHSKHKLSVGSNRQTQDHNSYTMELNENGCAFETLNQLADEVGTSFHKALLPDSVNGAPWGTTMDPESGALECEIETFKANLILFWCLLEKLENPEEGQKAILFIEDRTDILSNLHLFLENGGTHLIPQDVTLCLIQYESHTEDKPKLSGQYRGTSNTAITREKLEALIQTINNNPSLNEYIYYANEDFFQRFPTITEKENNTLHCYRAVTHSLLLKLSDTLNIPARINEKNLYTEGEPPSEGLTQLSQAATDITRKSLKLTQQKTCPLLIKTNDSDHFTKSLAKVFRDWITLEKEQAGVNENSIYQLLYKPFMKLHKLLHSHLQIHEYNNEIKNHMLLCNNAEFDIMQAPAWLDHLKEILNFSSDLLQKNPISKEVINKENLSLLREKIAAIINLLARNGSSYKPTLGANSRLDEETLRQCWEKLNAALSVNTYIKENFSKLILNAKILYNKTKVETKHCSRFPVWR